MAKGYTQQQRPGGPPSSSSGRKMYAGMTLTELRAEFETRKQQFLDLQANIKRDEEAGVPIRDLDELKKRVADVEKQYKDIEKYLRMFKRPGTSPSQ